MHSLCPTIAQLGLQRLPGELQPRLIEVSEELVGTGHPDQNRGTIGDQAEALLALQHCSFGLSPSRSLPHQPTNQHSLKYDQRSTGNEVGLISVPCRGLAVEDRAVRGKGALLKPPTLEGSPIEHVGIYTFYFGNSRRFFSSEHPLRHDSSHFSLPAEAREIAPDFSVIQVNIEQAKDWRIRCAGNHRS